MSVDFSPDVVNPFDSKPPQLVIGVALTRIPAASRRVKRVGRIVDFVVSGLLIVMGILLIIGLWLHVSTWLTTVFGQLVTL